MQPCWWEVQCHVGCASVKTVMNVCCASNIHALDTSGTWRNWAHPKSPIHLSMVDSRDGWCFSRGGGVLSDLIELGGREVVLNRPFVTMLTIWQGWDVRGMGMNKGFYSCFRLRGEYSVCHVKYLWMRHYLTLPNLGKIFYLSRCGLKYGHCRINCKYVR